MALSWMGGGKADHPMADAKQAQRIVAELPANDPGKALQEITEWLESLNATEGFKLDRRFENIDLLDGAAKNHQRKLSQDYLSTSRQQKFHENRLWNGINGYWKELGASYVLCIKHYENGFSGAGTIKKSLPAITARALRALTLQLKWSLVRYGPIEPRVWSELARLYQSAEQQGIAEGETAIYPGAHGGGTVRREFLKALMLSASSTDGLPLMRQEIAERAVAHFSAGFRLSATPEGCTHCFDLATPKAPVRLLKGVAPSPTVRFFGAGEAQAGLAQLMGKIREMGAIPADVNLGGSYEKDIVLGVLQHLSLQWSDNPPARGSERRKTASRITVVPGFGEILGVLDPANNDELDFSQEGSQNVESWIVENVSEGGYGAIIPPKKSDWIKVGTLLGVQSETSKYWGIGLIRRIAADEHQQRRVGIQLLTKAAIPVKVAKSGMVSSSNASREPQQAILLATAPDAQGEVGVVLRDGIFNGRDSLDMMVRDKAYLLMPSKMVEDGDDFDWAKFKVMQRSA